jgi:hypothetical protein
MFFLFRPHPLPLSKGEGRLAPNIPLLLPCPKKSGLRRKFRCCSPLQKEWLAPNIPLLLLSPKRVACAERPVAAPLSFGEGQGVRSEKAAD